MKRSLSKINRVLKNSLPNALYTELYLAYQKFFGVTVSVERLKKNASFVKEGVYDFKLDDTTFKIFLNPNNGTVDYDIFANRSFEGDILKLLRSELCKDDVFLDIGANIGQHSLYASHFCKHVYSFEPITRIYNQFTRSIFVNDILNISPYNYALGKAKEIIPIWSTPLNMGASSLLYSKDKTLEQNIKVLRLDDVYESLGIERVDIMKIDVEGYEYNVLLGAEGLIAKFKPKILIEFIEYNNEDTGKRQEIYELLKRNGYHDIYDVGSEGGRFVKVNSLEQALSLDSTNLYCKYVPNN